MEVPFYQHSVNKDDIARVVSTLEGMFLTTGEVTTEFEQKFAKLFGAKHCIGTTNCTSAAELALRIWDVGPGDEVILPTMSYVATAQVVAMRGAKPVFVDIDARTGLMDLNQVESLITENTKVIIPVHLYGVMVDMPQLKSLADKHGLKILEDSAHAVVSSRDGVMPGQMSDAAVFSFYATKNITSGEGGALICNDDEFAEKFRRGTCCGVTKTAYSRRKEGEKTYVGYDSVQIAGKCNMTNIQASLLVGQLDRLALAKSKRAKLVKLYRELLADIEMVDLPDIPKGVDSSHYVMVALLRDGTRDQLFKIFGEKGIGCAVNFDPIHLKTIFRELCGHNEGDFPIAENWGRRCVTLPLYPGLTEEQVRYVTNAIKEAYER